MILSWVHNQEKNVLECKITDKLHYVAHAGGRRIKKYVNDVKVAVFTDKEHDDSWEKEKHWLSYRKADKYIRNYILANKWLSGDEKPQPLFSYLYWRNVKV